MSKSGITANSIFKREIAIIRFNHNTNDDYADKLRVRIHENLTTTEIMSETLPIRTERAPHSGGSVDRIKNRYRDI